VAVIGAGLAGLAAAWRLEAGGVPVTVFEKSRGLGGRASTRRGEGRTFDLGAQYATARSAAFGGWLREAAAGGFAALWDGPFVDLEAGNATERREVKQRWVGTPWMSALARAETDLWLRDTKNGEWGPYDAVLVATPAPQAVPLLAPSPDLAKRAEAARQLPCVATMLAFESSLEAGFSGAFVGASPLSWIACNSSKPGRPDDAGECWVLHGSPEWSEAHLDEDDEALLEATTSAFSEALGHEVPTPLHGSVHRWRFARTVALGAEVFLWDEERQLGACGDWLGGDRLEGAWTSGTALGDAVASALRSR
jgi:predicted NAD/FAD-dependent oxidoreductase